MPISGPGSKIPGVKDGETPMPTSFKKVRAGDRVVLLLKGSHGGRYTGKCESQGSGKMSLSGTVLHRGPEDRQFEAQYQQRRP